MENIFSKKAKYTKKDTIRKIKNVCLVLCEIDKRNTKKDHKFTVTNKGSVYTVKIDNKSFDIESKEHYPTFSKKLKSEIRNIL